MNKIDWSKAPEGADFYAGGRFYQSTVAGFFYRDPVREVWTRSIYSNTDKFLSEPDYQVRPNHTVETNDMVKICDPVNNPKHYAIAPNIEAIDIIRAALTPEQFEGYLLGNFLKYRLRAGDKGDLQQDIDKSNWYKGELNK